MARNGSGTMNVSTTFSPSTNISSSAVNGVFTDVAAEITNSLAIDGQSTMTGQAKAANGTAAAPSITFGSDTDTGIYRTGANSIGVTVAGVLVATFDSGGLNLAAGSTYEVDAVNQNFFPATTAMLFRQEAAPTGWTKVTSSVNDKALRVTSGTPADGGTVAFETAFASQSVAGTVGNTTLTESQIPSHTHATGDVLTQQAAGYSAGRIAGGNAWATPENVTSTSDATGGGGSHTHTFTGTAINMDVQFIDVIIATKD